MEASTYIKYSFYTAGNYIFDVYNPDGGFIGTGKVEIKYDDASSTSSITATGPRVYFSTETPIAGIAYDVKSFKLPPEEDSLCDR
jgi:hypothetical protein